MSINAENTNCDKLQQLEKDLRDMEVAYDELVEKYERTKAINEELNEQLTYGKKNCELWRKDNDKLGMEAARSHEALNEAKEEIASLRKQLNNKIDDWMAVCEERDKYKELNLNLQCELQEQKDNYTELSKEFSDLLNMSTKDFGEMLVNSLAGTDAKKIKSYILDIVDRAVAKMPEKED